MFCLFKMCKFVKTLDKFSNIKTRPFFFFYGVILLILIFFVRSVKNWKIGEFDFFIESFSAIGLLIGAFYLVHKYLWKYPLIKLLYEVEDVSGIYEGTLTSSNKDIMEENINKEATAEIIQPNASDIYIRFWFKNRPTEESSTSESKTAKLFKSNAEVWKLEYSFINIPNDLYEKEILQIHEGYTVLTFSKDLNTLRGYYFTNQNNSNGNISLQKKD